MLSHLLLVLLFPICGGGGEEWESPATPEWLAELPRRYLYDLLLSEGTMLTVWIAYFDCNETGSSPMPNWIVTSRAQQTLAQWRQQTINTSTVWMWPEKMLMLAVQTAYLNIHARAIHSLSDTNCWLQSHSGGDTKHCLLVNSFASLRKWMRKGMTPSLPQVMAGKQGCRIEHCELSLPALSCCR